MGIVRVFVQSLTHLNVRGYLYVWANMLWFVLSLPIVTAPAAWAGLIHFSYAAQTQPQVSLEDFWAGFKANFWRGLLIGVLTLAIVYVNVVNMANFRVQNALVTGTLRALWLGVIGLWLTVQVYMWPLLEAMAQPAMGGALRNALVMIVQNPLYTLGLWVVVLLVVAISTAFFPVWFLLTGSTLAILSTAAVLDRLRAAGQLDVPETL